MSTKRIVREENTELSDAINDFAVQLAKLGYAFGALFIGSRTPTGLEFALLFRNTGLSQPQRMAMLDDIETAVKASRETFQQ